MVALLVEHLKLVILFLLIGTLVSLWHVSEWKATRRRGVAIWMPLHWR